MNFRPELAAKVMSGEKTVTRRIASDNPRSPWWLGRCKLQIGRNYAVCPGRGKHAIGRVRIVGVETHRLGHPSDDEARREGFTAAAAFEAAFTAINGTYPVDAWVWRIAFEVVTNTD